GRMPSVMRSPGLMQFSSKVANVSCVLWIADRSSAHLQSCGSEAELGVLLNGVAGIYLLTPASAASFGGLTLIRKPGCDLSPASSMSSPRKFKGPRCLMTTKSGLSSGYLILTSMDSSWLGELRWTPMRQDLPSSSSRPKNRSP